MRRPSAPVRLAVATAISAVAVVAGVSDASDTESTQTTVAAVPAVPPATNGISCDRGSRPERIQGRAPASDFDKRAAKGYFCNARQIAHFGHSGGFRVERYVDAAGHECAYWDSTLLYPTSAADEGTEGPGTYVMDMSDAQHPVHTDTLRTPAFQSPHESVRLNVKRGLIVADMGYPTAQPGFVDVFSVKKDCRHPELMASLPVGFLGHEGGFAPDGRTFYVASLYFHTLAAVDLTNPRTPKLIWMTFDYQPHGVSISNNGNRLYMAEAAFQDGEGSFSGLTVLDVSQIQKRVLQPDVPIVSRLTWPNVSTPQNATPFTRDGHKYVLETDEFGSDRNIGGARIIDIQNEKKPFVVSNLRLAVNQPEMQTDSLEADPGNDQPFQGYQAHYCTLPSRVNPNIVACSFIMSGLRVFDIRNPKHPLEIAYFNKPLLPGQHKIPTKAGSFAMSAPAYDQRTHDIWYTDGNTGFYVVRLTPKTGIDKFASKIVTPGN
jgi:hypothetical protein